MHRPNLVIEPIEMRLVFAQNLLLEGAIAVAQHFTKISSNWATVMVLLVTPLRELPLL